mmetsp:Transcript_6769/g.8242  ORF Transcript_6769/g.8242 Transcript_6769/m.8242 type:complete len:99 (+) Transcript_6769:230-526(+)
MLFMRRRFLKSAGSFGTREQWAIPTFLSIQAIVLRRSFKTLEKGKTFTGKDIIIKKSRFIGVARHCTNFEDARLFLDEIKKKKSKIKTLLLRIHWLRK